MDKTRIAVDVFNKHAHKYEAKYMDVSLYADALDIFCDSMSPNASVLELACGPGNLTKYMLGKKPALQILATDLAPNMLEIAKAANPSITTQLLDCREMMTLKRTFDGIVCGFGLPYLSKEEALQLIADAAQTLNPGGLLYLSTMEDDYEKSAWQRSTAGDEIFVYYHQDDYLVQGLEQNGFSILAQQHKQYTTPEGVQIFDLILVASI